MCGGADGVLCLFCDVVFGVLSCSGPEDINKFMLKSTKHGISNAKKS